MIQNEAKQKGEATTYFRRAQEIAGNLKNYEEAVKRNPIRRLFHRPTTVSWSEEDYPRKIKLF